MRSARAATCEPWTVLYADESADALCATQTPGDPARIVRSSVTMTECVRLIMCALRLHVVGSLQHLIRRRDRLGVRFVRTLCDDHVDDLRDGRDIGILEVAALQRPGAVDPGLRHRRRAGSGGLREQVF